MELQDLIVEYPNFISDECADKIRSWFLENEHLHIDGSVSGYGDSGYQNYVRLDVKKAKQSNPPPDHEISHLMTQIICDVYTNYSNIRPSVTMDYVCIKDYSVRVYEKNDGHFDCHIDQGPGGNVTRTFAVIIYLNDVDEGGETEFPNFNIKVKPEKGKVLIFPCNYLFPHSGNTPISGEKYIATAFINYKEFSC